MRRSAFLMSAVGLAGVAGAAWLGLHRGAGRWGATFTAASASEAGAPLDPALAASADAKGDAGKWGDRLAGRSLQLPTGAPASLSCQEARRIIAQVRQHLAAQPEAVDPQ